MAKKAGHKRYGADVLHPCQSQVAVTPIAEGLTEGLILTQNAVNRPTTV